MFDFGLGVESEDETLYLLKDHLLQVFSKTGPQTPPVLGVGAGAVDFVMEATPFLQHSPEQVLSRDGVQALTFGDSAVMGAPLAG